MFNLIFRRSVFALLLLLHVCSSFAHVVSSAEYKYPNWGSLKSTLASAIIDDSRKLDFRDYKFEVQPSKGHPPGDMNQFLIRYYPSRIANTGKIIFVMPGLGGQVDGNMTRFLAGKLTDSGFNVVIIPNDFQDRFIYAVSTNGYVGVTHEDAKDFYYAIQKTIDLLTIKENIKINESYLIGYSMGALCAAHVAEIDSRERKVDFNKIILLNPPVNMMYGMQQLDSFRKEEDNIGIIRKLSLSKAITGGQKNALKSSLSIDSFNVFINNLAKFSDSELKMAVGIVLASTIKNVVLATQDVFNLGVISENNKDKEASKFTFTMYAKEILTPFYQHLRSEPSLTFDKLSEEIGLRSIGDFLAKSDRVYLMHNQDDFLLENGDIQFLESVFAERAFIYPVGGHLGNLWYAQNIDQIKSWLQ